MVKRRRILLNGSIAITIDPADFVLVQKQSAIWEIICRGGIFTFDPTQPKPFNVERMTKDQVKAVMVSIKQFGGRDQQRFRPMLFADFQEQIANPKCIHEVTSVDDAKAADQREMKWRVERRQEHMRMLFRGQREER